MDISSNLSWNTHVDRITTNTNRSLGFIKPNIKTNSPQISISSSSPAGVYFSSEGPHSKDKTHKVEMVQRRAARWTLSDYARATSVTSLQTQLNWQTLEERRYVARLCLFYKIVNDLLAVPLPVYMQPTHRISRYCYYMTFRQIHTGKDYNRCSFFPLAIVQWNALPAKVAVSPSLEIFKSAVGQLQHPNL